MIVLEELKQRVNLVDLAHRLGCKKRATHADHDVFMVARYPDFPIKVFHDRHRWSGGASGEQGHCIDLAMYVKDCGYPQANRMVHELSGIHFFERTEYTEEDEQERADRATYIAKKSLENATGCIDYLVNQRGIPKHIVDIGIAKKTLGFSSWHNPGLAPGTKFYGGDAVAFCCYTPFSAVPVAVDFRYYDPKLNGDLKTMSQGPKANVFWTLDPKAVKHASTIYVCEGALDAMSIEAAFANVPSVCAIAQRGTQNPLDWAQFQGKTIRCCFDNDAPKPDKQNPNGPWRRPGAEAEWKIHELCLAANVSCQFVDKQDWTEGWDANDLYQASPSEAKGWLSRIEPWLIPGLSGKDERSYKRRLWLPEHDFGVYWKFRVRSDFMTKVRMSKDDEGDEIEKSEDIAGIRIAGISRVEIASATATMTGEKDLQPKVNFVAVVQSARHGAKLQRRVMDDEQLHNVEHWKKFGPIFKPADFSRIINIFERSIEIGGTKAVNFVGLAWLDGRVVVNEGTHCFFTDPKQQCPYSNALFLRGPTRHGLTIVNAYKETFKQSAALLPLIWIVGAQLKIFLGFWPHMIMQADKGQGKSTLIKRLERTTGMKMYSGQSLQTEFRLLTSISGTSHPIGWEEISARKIDIINKAVSLLQESYQYTETSRGAALTEFLICAPVLLAGEDVPVNSLLGKTTRTELTGKMGPLMPDNLPQFPMHNWMNWLVELGKDKVLDCYQQSVSLCQRMCRAGETDSGARRMITNYSALLTSWRLMAAWGGWDPDMDNVQQDIIAEMNSHISETSNDREPWIWIMETLFDEISSQRFPYPHSFESAPFAKTTDRLAIRISHIMSHLSTSVLLREKFNSLPVKSPRVLKKQLLQAGVVAEEDIRRSIHGQSIGHMALLDLTKMEQYGLFATIPDGKPRY